MLGQLELLRCSSGSGQGIWSCFIDNYAQKKWKGQTEESLGVLYVFITANWGLGRLGMLIMGSDLVAFPDLGH